MDLCQSLRENRWKNIICLINPMVLNLHWTGVTPEAQVSENGWLKVSERESFILAASLLE